MKEDKLHEFCEAFKKLKRGGPQEVEAFMGLADKVEKKGGARHEDQRADRPGGADGEALRVVHCLLRQRRDRRGGNRQEIIEAAWVGALMDSGPGLAHMVPVLKAAEESGAK